jgi:hypothetical protein
MQMPTPKSASLFVIMRLLIFGDPPQITIPPPKSYPPLKLELDDGCTE